METIERPYKLMNGQKLTEEEYKKFESLMKGQVIVRWLTDKEFEEAIKKAKNER